MYMSQEEYLTVRDALRLSQVDVTPDPNQGLWIATAAYRLAQDPEIRLTDPTALGEAAAKAGLRAQQAGRSSEVVSDWFEKSIDALTGLDDRSKRELSATYMLQGWSLSHQLVRKTIDNQSGRYPKLNRQASEAFENNEEILKNQHVRGEKWDRYGTMSAKHRAAFEATFGRANLAATTAIRGMWRAIRAEDEGEPTEKHRAFVKKQFLGNLTVGLLVVARPLDSIPIANAQRLKLARKMIG